MAKANASRHILTRFTRPTLPKPRCKSANSDTTHRYIRASHVMETASETDTLPSVSFSPDWFTNTRLSPTMQNINIYSNTVSNFNSFERRSKWSITNFFIFLYHYFNTSICTLQSSIRGLCAFLYNYVYTSIYI